MYVKHQYLKANVAKFSLQVKTTQKQQLYTM